MRSDRSQPRQPGDGRLQLSIVTTVYKSEETIREFLRRAAEAAHSVAEDYEIIVVDDGSPDRSLEIAAEIARDDPRLTVIELSRNFGHHQAMMTGMEHARGDTVFLIDSDLEEPPETLVRFHERLEEEAVDVVYGYQERRKGGLVERMSGALAYWLMRLLLPVEIPRNHITVRLMRADYVRALVMHKERQTAIGGLWVITGFRQVGEPVAKERRKFTTYSLLRRHYALVESITSFSEVPLIGVFYGGLVIMLTSAAVGFYLIARRLSGQILAGWVSSMVSIWFFGGLTVFSIGVVGLYISRIFIETKKRPYTIVRRIHGGSSSIEAGGLANDEAVPD